MENELRNALAAGNDVTVKIDVGYPAGESVRPDRFLVEASINGIIKRYPFTQ